MRTLFAFLLLFLPLSVYAQATLSPLDGPATAYRSLLFSPKEEALINEKIAERVRNSKRVAIQQDIVSAIQGPQEVTRNIPHPYFALSAIAFHGDVEWSAWINGVRYAPDQREGQGLRVLTATREAVDVEWKPQDFPVYAKRKSNASGLVAIDAATQSIRFRLSPNQSFSAYDLDILEGLRSGTRMEQIQMLETPAATSPAPSPQPQPPSLTDLPTAPLPAVPTYSINQGK